MTLRNRELAALLTVGVLTAIGFATVALPELMAALGVR